MHVCAGVAGRTPIQHTLHHMRSYVAYYLDHTHTHTHSRTHIDVYVCIYAYIHIQIHTYTCTYTYTYIYTYTYTYTYTCVCVCDRAHANPARAAPQQNLRGRLLAPGATTKRWCAQ